jgi:hypothetical protein
VLEALDRVKYQLVSIVRDVESRDPVVEFYKQGVDRTLIRENLRRSPEERLRALQALQRFAAEVRKAGVTIRHEQK